MARVHKKHGFHVELWQHKTSLSAECWQVAKYHIYHIYHHIYIYIPLISNITSSLPITMTAMAKMIQQPALTILFKASSRVPTSNLAGARSVMSGDRDEFFFSALNVGIFQCHKPTFSYLFGDGLYMFTPLSAVILGMVSYQVDRHFSSSFAGKSQRLTQRVAKHPCRPVECEKLGSGEFGEYQNNIK